MTSNFAALGGHIECLDFACDIGAPRRKSLYHMATVGRRLKCLKYLCEDSCLRNKDTCMYAYLEFSFFVDLKTMNHDLQILC